MKAAHRGACRALGIALVFASVSPSAAAEEAPRQMPSTRALLDPEALAEARKVDPEALAEKRAEDKKRNHPLTMLYRAQFYRVLARQRTRLYPGGLPSDAGPARVRMRALIKRDGMVEDITCIEGKENRAMADAAKRLLRSINGQLPPFSPQLRQVVGDYYVEIVTLGGSRPAQED